ncbi:DUF3324 domain-containing protein [Lactobacillus sp. DCY120]|uniref:DUF3324 domain-containing protein n=1 Tax=Bombilactobacillus apium TaxID=2675299 RepID=A0A850R2K1_9LACO|nr:DUF3324 domain-containing protein [Bombilactobacillus apium]NVY96241.1 DUF3324 domain-containing protein [Bombilactobacillus apium]
MSKKRQFQLLLLLLFLGGLLQGGIFRVQASLKDVTMTPIVSSATVTDRFQLQGKSHNNYRLQLAVTNFGPETMAIKIQPTRATTSSQGQLLYRPSAEDAPAPIDFSSLTSAQVLDLHPDQTRIVTFTIRLGAVNWTGLVLGGLYLSDIHQPQVQGPQVPVEIRFLPINQSGALKFQDFTPQVQAQRPVIQARLVNQRPVLMHNTKIDFQLRKRGFWELFGLGFKPQTQKQTYSWIAPNSLVPIVFEQRLQAIRPGTYYLKGTARTGKKQWHFSQRVRITAAQARKINQTSRKVIVDYTELYLGLIGLLLGLVILVSVGLWRQKRRNQILLSQASSE